MKATARKDTKPQEGELYGYGAWELPGLPYPCSVPQRRPTFPFPTVKLPYRIKHALPTWIATLLLQKR